MAIHSKKLAAKLLNEADIETFRTVENDGFEEGVVELNEEGTDFILVAGHGNYALMIDDGEICHGCGMNFNELLKAIRSLDAYA